MLKYYTLTAFFVIGIVTVLLGQILPVLSARLDLSDAESGTLFLAQFSGSIIGTFSAQRVARRYGFTFSVLTGLFMIAAGLPGINAGSFPVCWISIFVYGSGLGVTIPGMNLLTMDRTDPHLRSSAVNLLNFCWGLGAIVSQPFVAAFSKDGSLVTVSVVLVIAMLILMAGVVSSVRDLKQTKAVEAGARSPAQVHIWRNPSAWLFVGFSFFVVGIEGGLGGWLTTYSEVLKLSGVNTVNLTVVYFTFFVVGRGLAAIVARRISENVLIFACSLILIVGVAIIVSSEFLVVLGAAVAGLGSSALFPTHMVRFTRVYGPSATLQAAPIFIAGTTGAAIVSSLIGFISSSVGSLRAGIAAVLVSGVLVLVLHLAINAFSHSASPADEPV